MTAEKLDLAWGFAAFVIQFATALALMPALLHYLSANELGLWYAYQAVAGMAMLLEFGYQSTFARNITYVAHGASSLRREGLAPAMADSSHDVDLPLMSSLLRYMDRKYGQIAFAMLALLVTVGTSYIIYIARGLHLGEIIAAWLVFVAFTCVSFSLGRFTVVLTGFSLVRQAQQFQICGRLATVICTLILLHAGLGLGGAVAGYGIGALLIPVLAAVRARRIATYRDARLVDAKGEDLAPVLWHNARKTGEASLGTFLAQRATTVVASAFLPLAEFASFSFTLQFVQLLTQFARVKFQMSMPALVRSAGQWRFAQFRQLFWQCMGIAYVIYLSGMAGLLVVGQDVLTALGSSIPLLNPTLVLMLAFLYLLEVTYGNCAWALTCFNVVPFVRATWITGALIAVLSLGVGVFTTWGVAGFITVQLVSHLMYNAWKWPLELYRKVGSFSSAAGG